VDKPAGRYCEAVCAAASAAAASADTSATPLVLVHRLDRDTSGVLLLAKRRDVLPALSRAFGANASSGDARGGGGVCKLYVAHSASPLPREWPLLADGGAAATAAPRTVTSGHGRSAGGLWRAYAAADVGAALPGGGGAVRAATTLLTPLPAAAAGMLLLAAPAQGRTHQIRIHAALAGVPLTGDVRYGGAAAAESDDAGDAPPPTTFNGHRLHAALLALRHPASGAPLALVAPLPAWARGAETALGAAKDAWLADAAA
jgi:23S rRNA-/tRNA-specific pseudouridylate synthase